ncbi:hypothetical protein FRC07_010094 [Ceratobasidium sp. 392]|nr:hypothetical protein FRC07_010094 [Ceratobasidium sp. 392]
MLASLGGATIRPFKAAAKLICLLVVPAVPATEKKLKGLPSTIQQYYLLAKAAAFESATWSTEVAGVVVPTTATLDHAGRATFNEGVVERRDCVHRVGLSASSNSRNIRGWKRTWVRVAQAEREEEKHDEEANRLTKRPHDEES